MFRPAHDTIIQKVLQTRLVRVSLHMSHTMFIRKIMLLCTFPH